MDLGLGRIHVYTGFVKGGASTFARCQRQCIEARAHGADQYA